MFARFDENPVMTLQDIKKIKTLRTDARTDARTDNVETVYPPQTKFVVGIITTSDPSIYDGPSCFENSIGQKRDKPFSSFLSRI